MNYDEYLGSIDWSGGVDLEATQVRAEEFADAFEANRVEAQRLADLEKGNTGDPKVQAIMRSLFEDVEAQLSGVFEGALSGGSGAKYHRLLRELDLEVLTGLALAQCFKSLLTSAHPSLQLFLAELGKAIVIEIKIRQAQKVNPMYMQNVEEGLKRRKATSPEFMHAVFSKAHSTVMKGNDNWELSNSDYMQIGKVCGNALMNAGLCETYTQKRRGKLPATYIKLNEEVEEFLKSSDERITQRVMSSQYRKMLCKPDEWTSLDGGGFKTLRRKLNAPLLKRDYLSQAVHEEYSKRLNAETAPIIFKCANYLQGVAFKMKLVGVELLQKVWDVGGGIFEVPIRDRKPKPEFPFGDDWVKDKATPSESAAFLTWKRAMVAWHEEDLERKTKQREMWGFFRSLDDPNQRFYFPVFLDYRGRWYYNAAPNPQGTDVARGCLVFADKKPLGSRGLYWLKVHLANSLGFDKKRNDLRVTYVDSIWDTILLGLSDPIEHAAVFGTDAPISAYVVANEIKEALESGCPETFESDIPIHMDATVSGTQHFSALLRDEIGAEYTNLRDVGGEDKADLYMRVAGVTLDLIKQDDSEFAEQWLKMGIARSLSKKPVMTYTYGVTRRTCCEYIWDHLAEDFPELLETTTHPSVAYLATKLFEAIEITIPATVQGMDWLRAVGSELGDSPITWTTPSGMWCRNAIPFETSKRIKINALGQMFTLVRHRDKHKVDKRKMISSLAPNFIHSMDASHLTLTAVACQEAGLDLVTIHDSYGTHACDVDTMHVLIRSEFVKMYSEDVLAKFKEEVGAQLELPEYGSFDLELVKESEFFFC